MPRDAGYLYAIKAEGTNYVKIGCTTGAVETRRKTLQTGQPFPLTILAAIRIEGDLSGLERQMHTALAAQRHHGEWFELALDAGTFLQLVEETRQSLRPTRGGKPTGDEPYVKLTIMVEPQTVEGIDRLMAKMQATLRSVRVDRSTAAREALTLGLEQAGCVEGLSSPAPRPAAQVTKEPARVKRPTRREVEGAA